MNPTIRVKKLRADAQLPAYGNVPATGEVMGIGGTATSLAALAAGLTVYDARKVHGTRVTAAQLQQLEDRIFAAEDVRAAFPVLSQNRARVIGHGAIAFRLLLDYLGKSAFTASEKDNMDGYLLYKKDV